MATPKLSKTVKESVLHFAKIAERLGLSYPIGRACIAHRNAGRHITHTAIPRNVSKKEFWARKRAELENRMRKYRERDAELAEEQFKAGISITKPRPSEIPPRIEEMHTETGYDS